MKNVFKNLFIDLVVIACWFVVISLCWIGLEYIVDGQIIHQYSDDIIALIISVCITNKIGVKVYRRRK